MYDMVFFDPGGEEGDGADEVNKHYSGWTSCVWATGV